MKFKYPRTPHLPWSPGATSDDKMLKDTDCFEGKNVVVSLKYDGEATSMYRDYYHARSVDSKDHPSRHYVKGFWAQVRYYIPEGWRVCGENMYAKHSIHYTELDDYFLVYSIWDRDNFCIPYEDTIQLCALWGMTHIPVLYEGPWRDSDVETLNNRTLFGHEGYVVRNAGVFHYNDFNRNVAKYVVENHVQTDQHWMHSKIIPNKI